MWRYILQLERINILAETQQPKQVAFIIYKKHFKQHHGKYTEKDRENWKACTRLEKNSKVFAPCLAYRIFWSA